MRPHRRATVADSLRQRIISGDFAPGTRLSEESLAKAENVSRNTLREAFRVLQEQRLVEHLPNRGVFVAAPGRADVADIYRVRTWIESMSIASARPDHPQVHAMRAAVADAEGPTSRATAPSWRPSRQPAARPRPRRSTRISPTPTTTS